MFIYCSGDSFTHGSELADDTIPGWPGLVMPLDFPNMKKGRTWVAEKRSKVLASFTAAQYAEYHKLEMERAWPSKLGTLVNATVVNSGVNGSSQDSTNYRTMVDIERLLKSGKQIDRVFIQITEPQRISLYDSSWSLSETNHHVVSRMLSMADSCEYNEKMFLKYWDLVQPDSARTVRFLKDIIMIRNYVNSKLGFEPIFVDSWVMTMIEESLRTMRSSSIGQSGELQTLIEASGILDSETWTSTIPSMKLFEDIDKPHKCPGGHFAEEIHDHFAKFLANTYF